MIVLMDENASTPKQVNVFSSVFVLVHYQPHKSLLVQPFIQIHGEA